MLQYKCKREVKQNVKNIYFKSNLNTKFLESKKKLLYKISFYKFYRVHFTTKTNNLIKKSVKYVKNSKLNVLKSFYKLLSKKQCN